MKKRGIVIFVIFIVLFVVSCNKSIPNPTENSSEDPIESPYETEVMAEGLNAPWEMVVMEDGKFLITEREGRILFIQDEEQFIIPGVVPKGEGGLLGMALSPSFRENHLMYVYYTYTEENKTYNRVSQFRFIENRMEDEQIILDQIPGSRFHNGGRIKFGPDDKLYVTTGDAQEESLSQDMTSLAGKILRLNSDGLIPFDNPFPDSLIYALGIRNAQGLAWHPTSLELFASDHGPRGRDEVNQIVPGGNYGWPFITCDEEDSRYLNPIACYSNFTLAPSGIDFHSIEKENGEEVSLYVAGLRGNRVMKIDFDEEGKFSKEESILEEFGRVRTVVNHDNSLYILTNNTDGRGTPKEKDDKLIKITFR